MIFCDTSAVAKLYFAEKESPVVRGRLESEEQDCIAEVIRVELHGAFHRQLREKMWTRDQFMTAIRQLTNDDLGGFWSWLPVENQVIEAAAKTYMILLETVFLQGADCLHLVKALHNGFTEIYTYAKNQTAVLWLWASGQFRRKPPPSIVAMSLR